MYLLASYNYSRMASFSRTQFACPAQRMARAGFGFFGGIWHVRGCLLLTVEAEAGLYGGSPTDVKNMFASAQNYGINVIRFFPFGVFSDFTLQTAPGELCYSTAASRQVPTERQSSTERRSWTSSKNKKRCSNALRL